MEERDIFYYVKDDVLAPFKNEVSIAVLKSFWDSTGMMGVEEVHV